jgi:subtilisin-like proprotein convertase family protein
MDTNNKSVYSTRQIIVASVLLGLALSLLWSTSAHADDPVGLSPIADWFSGDADDTRSVAWGDVDGDGDLDLAAGNYSGPNKVYLNEDGILQTTAAWTSAGSDFTTSMAWGDVDGDGDLDLAVGNDGSPNTVYLNQGGVLQTTPAWTDNITDSTTSVVWGDMNSDGSLDLAVGNSDKEHHNKVYLNQDGALQATPAWVADDQDSFYYGTNSLAWGDVDGDGDLDLAAGCAGSDRVYLNQGGILQTTPIWIADYSSLTYSVAWGDMDGDGDLDLATGSMFGGGSQVYLNTGETLQTTPAWHNTDGGYTNSIAWADVNGDGALDLVAGNEPQYDFGCECYVEGENKIYLNQGDTLQTTGIIWAPADRDDTSSVAWGDMNGDGALDLAVGNAKLGNKVYLNKGRALHTGYTLSWDYASSVAWGDADGDGDLDLAVGILVSEGENAVFLNEDGHLWDRVTWTPVYTSDRTYGLAWGDMDGDGDLDLAVGNYGSPSRVYLNNGLDGTGYLQLNAAWSSDDADYTRSIAWGDVDGDGDLDLAVGNSGVWDSGRYLGEPDKVYLNEGGVLQTTAVWMSRDSDPTLSVAWGDMDGDGDLDLATGNWFAPSKVYLNEGGILQTIPAWESAGGDSTTSVAWGDMDGDGDLDLAAGNSGEYDGSGCYCYLGAVNKAYLNKGGMLETIAAWISGDNDGTMSIAWGDVDSDGDLDLAAGNYAQSNKVYINERGRLQTAANNPWVSNDGDSTMGIAWGDVDGDGDLDLAAVSSGYGETYKIYLSQQPPPPLYPGQAAWASIGLSSDSAPTFNQPVTVLAPANFYATPGIRQAATIPVTYTLFNPSGAPLRAIHAFYSPDGGGRWYTATAANGTVTTNLTVGQVTAYAAAGLPQPIPDDGSVLNVPLFIPETHTIADVDVWLAITHTWDADLDVYLQSPEGTLVELFTDVGDDGDNFDHTVLSNQALRSIAFSSAPFTGTYRPEGNLADFNGETTAGTWTLVITDDQAGYVGTLAAWGLRITTAPPPHIYTWDVFGSGFFGQSDNVILRLETYPVSFSGAPTGTYRYTDTVPGPYQQPYIAAQTFPFRVRGNQVQVLSGTMPVSNAVVYRLPAEWPAGGFPLADGHGEPFRTDTHGYLRGRGQIAISDTLLAMLPVHTATSYAGMVEFDGVDDWIEASDFDIDDDFTLSLWVNPDTMNRQAFIGKHTSDGDNLVLFGFYFGGYYFNLRNSIFFSGTLETGWKHLAVVGDADGGTTHVTVYRNGQVVWQHDFGAVVGDISGSKPWAIGQDWDPGSEQGDFFDGQMDDIRIWNIARTQAQIQADMSDRLKGDEPGLVAYWPFDTPVEHIAFDQSGNSRAGVLKGAIWSGDYLGGYTAYHTSGAPTEDGVDAFAVEKLGVQVLTVTAAHPLILFDISVSLEWDAHGDPVYLQQLEFDLKKASAYLYDFTDGQVALGAIAVYQNADNWADSHVAVHATNHLRPFAAQGGIVLTTTVDPQHEDIVYGVGQVHMGATWNRYGTPGQNLGQDWPLILAHELSHYLLYQDDTYLGLDDAGMLIPVDSCTGSAMGDVYTPDNTEFISDTTHWDADCATTLAARTLGRTEWATLQLWYPWLVTPTVANAGPSLMPFDLTTVIIRDPLTETDSLEDPTFYLDYEGGGSQLLGGAGISPAQRGHRHDHLRVCLRPGQPGGRTEPGVGAGSTAGGPVVRLRPSAEPVRVRGHRARRHAAAIRRGWNVDAGDPDQPGQFDDLRRRGGRADKRHLESEGASLSRIRLRLHGNGHGLCKRRIQWNARPGLSGVERARAGVGGRGGDGGESAPGDNRGVQHQRQPRFHPGRGRLYARWGWLHSWRWRIHPRRRRAADVAGRADDLFH